MKPADTLGSQCPDCYSGRGCARCQEAVHCDLCGRKVCVWVAVHVYQGGKETEDMLCRPCARAMGAGQREIDEQVLDLCPLTPAAKETA